MTERAKSEDERKTKERLIHELQFLRQKVTDSDRLLDEITSMYKEAPIGLCVFDLNLRYMHINGWLATINGVPVEEHLGRSVREVLPDVAEGVEPQLRHVIESGEPILGGTVEAETPARPGIRRTFQHNYYPIKSGDDTIIGVSCVVEDVTELRRAEETLKESERTLASAQRIAGLGHWLWDEVENRIITVSEQLARIFGVEPEKFPRTSEGWFAFIHPDDRARAVAEIERCIANRSVFDLEYRIVRSDGQIHFVRDLSEPLFDDSGRIVRTLGTLLDITELKQVEHRLGEPTWRDD